MDEKEVKMHFQNLGIPSHLVPDTALYCATVPHCVSSDFVAYPDMGKMPNQAEIAPVQIISNKKFFMQKSVEKNSSCLNER